MGKLVVLRPGALGDAVVTLPVLAALGTARPGAQRTVIGHPLFRLAAEAGLVEEWVGFDDARLLPLFGGGQACPLVADADLCIAYGGSEDGGLASGLAQSGVRRVVLWPARPPTGVHVVDHLLAALEPAGIEAVTRTPRLAPQAPWLASADALLAGRGMGDGFVAVHPGSGGRAKRWPPERFAEVVRRLARPVVWLLGPAEGEADAERLRAIGERVGSVVVSPDLTTLAGILARCRLYMGNDSGVSHLAAAIGAPTVAVFGATDPRCWAPRGERVAVVGSPERGGLDGVTPDGVLAAARGVTEVRPAP